MNKKKWIIVTIIAVIAALLIILFVWGLYGGILSREDPGITCDFGFGKFCWKWHKNILGKARDLIEEADLDKISQGIRNFLENNK